MGVKQENLVLTNEFRQSSDEGLTLETSAFQIFHGAG